MREKSGVGGGGLVMQHRSEEVRDSPKLTYLGRTTGLETIDKGSSICPKNGR